MFPFSEKLSDIELETLAKKAQRLTLLNFGRTIQLYAPVYLSNRCINSCRYCGFNKHNKIERTTLTPEEVLSEIDFLVAQGHRHLLLVAGEDPNTVSLPYLEEIVSRARNRVAKLLIEVQPFDETSYRKLREAGVDGVTLYQETYHQKTYELMHPEGLKADFNMRLEAIDAAGRAGMSFLGIGALLGLYDWRFEAASLIDHARRLQKKFWRSHISVSFPRIRDAASNFKMPCPVSDRELVQMIIAVRLALPKSNLIISTREPPTLRDHLIKIGITQMSAGSITKPGGYTKTTHSGNQFATEDTRPSAVVAEMLSESGYQPVFKDWERT